MKKKNYLPNKQADRLIWVKNFRIKIDATYAALLTLLAGDVTLLDKMTDYYVNLLDVNANISALSQNFTSYKDNFCNAEEGSPLAAFSSATITVTAPVPTKAGLWDHVAKMADDIKRNALYTDAIGQDLG